MPKTIYLFLKRDNFFKFKKLKEQFVAEQKDRYVFKFFNSSKVLLEKFLFNPPDMVLIDHEKDPSTFEQILALKKDFNLTTIPIVLVVNNLDFEFLMKKAEVVDDFVLIYEDLKEVILRIEYAFKRIERISDNNPLTGLPGNTSISKFLEKIIKEKQKVVIGYVDLDNFKAYNDVYGFSRGDEVIKNLARILASTLNEKAREGSFLGHIGGDDFVFVVPIDKAEEVAKEIIRKFESTLSIFLKEKDLKKGFLITKDRQGHLSEIPLPSVSIALIPVYPNKFRHIGELSQRAAEVKAIVKKMKGSNYFIDRRK
ncbi:GGDEF domain-containing protein [Thermodesulfobacterium sp. TA1]|uniref:GGDEF domain-containing protein n=1 Tax=Thermodesulfobacterium sp. TA1 TaxID=2234087 RepID=UPI001232773D|nr:GGDEF domain-containing protein [Thermodesulfobacterium sp. TA1]QER41848.1 GGDEF domain-containing protein [Thermodesulfobacterium sp. TA1]